MVSQYVSCFAFFFLKDIQCAGLCDTICPLKAMDQISVKTIDDEKILLQEFLQSCLQMIVLRSFDQPETLPLLHATGSKMLRHLILKEHL